MATQMAKKDRAEPMHFELAEWFYKRGEDVAESREIALRIKKIKESRGFECKEVTYKEYQGWIKDVREYLETRYQLTLVNVKLSGAPGAYKVADDQEATLYGVRQYKRFMLQADRVRRITPLMKRQYIWPSVKQVFGRAEEEAKRFQQLGEKFLLAYAEDEKAIKEQKREENKNAGNSK